MTIEQIAKRLAIGPASAGELMRSGATEEQIGDMIRAGVAVVLQYHIDPDALIIGGY
ncbi:hypothetical protein [Citrobacter amalonaticus]|uniref:Uncharacterized protein n=1 Tax=Citrobacter amalonaticus TaxID=35703 RepID=A0AAX2BNY9_CITAM|nr:hypothetical protein [Citrobacter amalonaticus]SBA20829.1 protein of unknown function [Citrobacter amalonaticus]